VKSRIGSVNFGRAFPSW